MTVRTRRDLIRAGIGAVGALVALPALGEARESEPAAEIDINKVAYNIESLMFDLGGCTEWVIECNQRTYDAFMGRATNCGRRPSGVFRTRVGKGYFSVADAPSSGLIWGSAPYRDGDVGIFNSVAGGTRSYNYFSFVAVGKGWVVR